MGRNMILNYSKKVKFAGQNHLKVWLILGIQELTRYIAAQSYQKRKGRKNL
jgi:hypothetical protein